MMMVMMVMMVMRMMVGGGEGGAGEEMPRGWKKGEAGEFDHVIYHVSKHYGFSV